MKISPARVWREKNARYRLEGGRCKRCGKLFYPPKTACPYCGCLEVEKTELPKRGKVLSFAIEHGVPEGFRHQAPIIVALIELENGVKVVSTLTDVNPEEVYIGMSVEATLRRIWEESDEGIIIYGIKFIPTE
jgi:uncharacterized OB-fold protein